MDNNLIHIAQERTDLIKREQSAFILENRFSRILDTFKTDVTNTHYLKIIAINSLYEREYKQTILIDIPNISYISDIPSTLLSDNNINFNTDLANVLTPTLYFILENDESLTKMFDYLESINASDFVLRIYINIEDIATYSVVESEIIEKFPTCEIISYKDDSPEFNPKYHYTCKIDTKFLPWDDEFSDIIDSKKPYLDFQRVGNVVSPTEVCLYELAEGRNFLTSPYLVESVGYLASKLVLMWDPHIKTFTEYLSDYTQVRNYPIFYHHYITFIGFILRVTLDIEYKSDIFGNCTDVIRRNVKNLDVHEPSEQQLTAAILLDPYFSKESLFVLDDQVCFVKKVTPNIHLRLGHKNFATESFTPIEHHSRYIRLLTPLDGSKYKSLSNSDVLKIPENIKSYIIRSTGYGTGWWATYNTDHQIVLRELLKIYSLEKLISLNIYNVAEGFLSDKIILEMGHSRWFE